VAAFAFSFKSLTRPEMFCLLKAFNFEA